jgi:hypothetical protein
VYRRFLDIGGWPHGACPLHYAHVYTWYLLAGGSHAIVELRKWGNSLAVRIPKALAKAIKARDGRRVESTVKGDTLVLRPLARP